VRLGEAAREALIERTRSTRITRANAPAIHAKARKCQWCGRPASKGAVWCVRHAPGLASQRLGRRYHNAASGPRARLIMMESASERILPAELEAWPPIARIIAHRPRHTRPVLLSDVIAALVSRGIGDHEPWAVLVSRMRDTGIMRDRDKDLTNGA
jgi:hypothetical protein